VTTCCLGRIKEDVDSEHRLRWYFSHVYFLFV